MYMSIKLRFAKEEGNIKLHKFIHDLPRGIVTPFIGRVDLNLDP